MLMVVAGLSESSFLKTEEKDQLALTINSHTYRKLCSGFEIGIKVMANFRKNAVAL
jgi:hypothetical protein